MTSTDIGVVDRAKAKVTAVEAKGASYVPQIIEAHKRVVDAERSGHQRSLDAAIAAGQLLIDAKDAIKGQFKWTEWRSEYLREIPQTTASLYMRLAKNQDRLRRPNLATDDGKRISNAVANLAASGELSVRKAAALLVEKKPRGKASTGPGTNEDIGREWLKSLAADELLNWLMKDHDGEWRKALWVGLGKEFQATVSERRF
jgi:hypothetical protein